ncbi:ranBP2-like and GRIP domain-containing protein 3 isoform X1 [Dysidea avara]|uniref:ranBP2-like and GRIP domain-containing protein 3 isoform X1 n=1 Tax=Dysidea avara TaxID=196820 RepID=UPI00332A771E
MATGGGDPMQVQTTSVTCGGGGYDCNFVQSPPDDLLCKICLLPACDAILSVCCGHSFCKCCLDCYLKSEVIDHSNCPYCREESFQSFPDKKTTRLVLNLQVFCPNKSQGCSWVGELRSVEDHLTKNSIASSTGCLFTEICCSNECGMVIQRRLLEDHLKLECELRQVKCEYCGSTGSYQWINGSHQQECLKYPIECPNHCEVGHVRREEMSVHLGECPIVKCPFAVVGCNSVVRKEERMGHMKEALGQHVECNKEAIVELERAKVALEEQLQAKEQELADIKNTMKNLKKTIDEKGKELDEMKMKAEERVQIVQESMKQLKEMFEQELMKLRRELNVGVFSFDTNTFNFADFAGVNVGESGLGSSSSSSNQGFNAPENFEPTAEFKPVVKLSDVVVSSGEENEVELFSNRARLYRFDETLNQWKERGVGNIKILRHKNTGRVRVLMRRDQVLKVCCNHMLVKGMRLVPRDEKSFTWLTLGDLSDLEARAEIFTVKFQHANTATAFQDIFSSYGWKCHKCYILYGESICKCVACGSDHIPTTSSCTCSVTLCRNNSVPVTTSPSLPAIVAPSKQVFAAFDHPNTLSEQVIAKLPSGTGVAFVPPKIANDSSKPQN